MEKIFWGIDIGGTNIKLGAFTQEGQLLLKDEMRTDLSDNGARIMPEINEKIRHIAQEKGWDWAQMAGAGVGVPGPVQSSGFVERCVDLHWYRFNPREELSALLGVPVTAGNDANMAAMGEYWQGSGRNFNSLMFITLGTGVGSGIIMDGGRMIYGAKGLGGEIGHTVICPEEKLQCTCGHYGCLDQMASATGIVRNAHRYLERTDALSVLRNRPDFTCQDVFDAAKGGDKVAADALQYCLSFLGKSLAYASYIVDPEVFILGGGVSRAGQYMVDIVEKVYRENAQMADSFAEIRLAALGNDAGIIGSAGAAILAQKS